MALPDYSGGGFYDPQKSYQGSVGQMNVQQQMPGLYQAWGTDTNPQGVYQAYLAKLGLGGLGSRARTAQQLYGQVQGGYQAALTNNYELMFPEYLDQAGFEDTFKNMSYDQQGLDPGRFGQSKYRWGMRSG